MGVSSSSRSTVHAGAKTLERRVRVAALYDIHGNLPALEAVLDDVRREHVDRIVVGGDIFPGPMAREVLARLRDLDIPTDFIRGNCETATLAERAGRDVALPEQARETIRWCAGQIDQAEAQFLAGWPPTLTLEIDGVGAVLFCHATPRDDNEIFTFATDEHRLAPAFSTVTTSLVVCGHTHMQFDRTVGKVRVVNAGSVGMPFGEPGAYWLLLGPRVELQRTDYDREKAAARIRRTDYPQAEHFAAHHVLDPPPARQMLDLFARADFK